MYVTITTLIIGTKNVAKELAKLTKGRVRDKGVTWFPELVDKREWNSFFFILYIIGDFYRQEYKGPFILGYEEL